MLVGMMGCGKSTIGPLVAQRLGVRFTDADRAVEHDTGKTVAQIFDALGEAGFRAIERRVVASLVEGCGGVIALGGGAFADDDLRTLILRKAIAVWLDVDIDELARRVGHGEGRPLLQGRAPRAVLTAITDERRAHYQQAHVHVRHNGLAPAAMAEAVIAALGPGLSPS